MIQDWCSFCGTIKGQHLARTRFQDPRNHAKSGCLHCYYNTWHHVPYEDLKASGSNAKLQAIPKRNGEHDRCLTSFPRYRIRTIGWHEWQFKLIKQTHCFASCTWTHWQWCSQVTSMRYFKKHLSTDNNVTFQFNQLPHPGPILVAS